jgi:hypothetical protein
MLKNNTKKSRKRRGKNNRTYSKGGVKISRKTTTSQIAISAERGSNIRHHLIQLSKNNNDPDYSKYTTQIRLNEDMLEDFYKHLDQELHTFRYDTINRLAPCLSQLQEEAEPKANLYLHYINNIIDSGYVHGIPFKNKINFLSREHSKKHSRFQKELKSDIYKTLSKKN